MLKLGIKTETAVKQLNLLTLDPQKRRRIMRGAGRKVRRDSRTRLKTQRDLSGGAWKARSNGRKTRMLRKLSRNLQVRPTENLATVTFAKTRVGQVARAHQEGVTQTMDSKIAEQISGKANYDAPASRRQAKALREAGYKIRRKKGKGWKKPTLIWITENLSSGKAGLVLRILRDNKKTKKNWDIELPARSFLGQNKSEKKQLDNFMLDEAIRL